MSNSIAHRLAGLIVLVLVAASGADAAQRTFVSTSGVNNPACSLIAPCRDFAAAMAATSVGGEIIVLNSGGYGSVTVNKNVSIVSPPGVYAGVSVFSGDGITVDDGGSNTIAVVLRGLTINGQGGTHGIRIVHAKTVHVEACNISNLTQNGIYQSGGALFVKDTIARNNGNVGAYILGSGVTANFDRVRMEANLNGIYVQDGAQAFIQDSVLSGNGVYGAVSFSSVVPFTGSITNVSIRRTLVTNNAYGVAAESDFSSSYALLDIADSQVINNAHGIYGIDQNGGAVEIAAARNTIARNDLHGVQLVPNGVSPGETRLLIVLDENVIGWNASSGVVAPDGTGVFARGNNPLLNGSVIFSLTTTPVL